MAASISRQEPDRVSGQAKIDVLLVGDVAVQPLADVVQQFFSNLAEVTVTVGDVQGAVALLAQRSFQLVFLRVTSPVARSLRFGKKKNTHFLFVFIIPEHFKEHGADITITEPLTAEKLTIVAKYWKTYFSNTVKSENSPTAEEPAPPLQESCTEHLGHFSADLFACSDSLSNDIGLELKSPLSDFERNRRISLLHSSKEKLRRERIKRSCQQLRALVPGPTGRKNDAASVLEATVEHVKRIRDRIPPAVMGQITEALQSNRRFCKKQAPSQLPLPDAAVAPRENSVLASMPTPARGISFLANRCFSVLPALASGGPSDGTVSGPSNSPPDEAAGDFHRGQAPSPALSRGSSCAVRYCPAGVPSWDAATITSQSISGLLPSPGPSAPKCLPPHCSSVLGQACAAHPGCLDTENVLTSRNGPGINSCGFFPLYSSSFGHISSTRPKVTSGATPWAQLDGTGTEDGPESYVQRPSVKRVCVARLPTDTPKASTDRKTVSPPSVAWSPRPGSCRNKWPRNLDSSLPQKPVRSL